MTRDTSNNSMQVNYIQNIKEAKTMNIHQHGTYNLNILISIERIEFIVKLSQNRNICLHVYS